MVSDFFCVLFFCIWMVLVFDDQYVVVVVLERWRRSIIQTIKDLIVPLPLAVFPSRQAAPPPPIPPSLVIDAILPFVNDRVTWNAVQSLNREIYHAIKQQQQQHQNSWWLPPWPEVSQRVILPRRNNNATTAAGSNDDDNDNDGTKIRRQKMVEMVECVVFHPNGSALVCSCGGLNPQSHAIHLWDRIIGRQVEDDDAISKTNNYYRYLHRHHRSMIRCLAVSPCGTWLASGSNDRSVKLWRFQRGVKRQDPYNLVLEETFLGHETPILSLAFSPDSQMLASGSFGQDVRVWKNIGGNGTTTKRSSGDGSIVRRGEFIDLRQGGGGLQHRHFHHLDAVRSLSFSTDGRQLSVGSDDTIRSGSSSGSSKVVLWNISDHDNHSGAAAAPVMRVLPLAHCTRFNCGACASFSPCGRYFVFCGPASLSTDTTNVDIMVLDAESLVQQAILRGHTEQISALAFSKDGSFLASSSSSVDATIWIWNMNTFTGQELGGDLDSGEDNDDKHLHHSDFVQTLAWSSDGRTLASGSWDGTFRLWDATKFDSFS